MLNATSYLDDILKQSKINSTSDKLTPYTPIYTPIMAITQNLTFLQKNGWKIPLIFKVLAEKTKVEIFNLVPHIDRSYTCTKTNLDKQNTHKKRGTKSTGLKRGKILFKRKRERQLSLSL